jgi:hypothetical protein
MINVMAVVWILAMAFPVYWAIASNASLMLAYAVSFLCKPFPPLRLRVSAVIKNLLVYTCRQRITEHIQQ